jgi:hypothetical protein
LHSPTLTNRYFHFLLVSSLQKGIKDGENMVLKGENKKENMIGRDNNENTN